MTDVFSATDINSVEYILYLILQSFKKWFAPKASVDAFIHVHAATNFLTIPAAQYDNNNRLSPLVHHYSSCSSLEFRVLPFSLRPTL